MDVDGIFLIVRFFLKINGDLHFAVCELLSSVSARSPMDESDESSCLWFQRFFFTCFLNIKSFIIVGFLYGFLVLFSWSLVFKRNQNFAVCELLLSISASPGMPESSSVCFSGSSLQRNILIWGFSVNVRYWSDLCSHNFERIHDIKNNISLCQTRSRRSHGQRRAGQRGEALSAIILASANSVL